MNKKLSPKAIGAAVGGTLAAGLAISPAVQADENPFSITELSAGYMLAENAAEAQCGEAKCGGAKPKRVSESNCGAKKAEEATCGARKEAAEAKCGAKQPAEAKCGSKS